MTKSKQPEEFVDIPSWLMTFSDVITLLMTFFILLLTFATNEPERFERMQTSMFGGGGATGVAAKADGAMDDDALSWRERQRSGRITQRGSEMPPLHIDAVYESLDKGVAGLESNEARVLSTQHGISISWSLFVTDGGQLSSLGEQYLKMLAKHMRRQPIDADFIVGQPSQIAMAQTLTSYLFEEESIQPGRLGIGHAHQDGRSAAVNIILTRPLPVRPNGN